ncbi:hypothetical protein F8388_005126 [Cannabis sativa]|uniref:Uncharacterized protein n=1 Tax=Cannabis sativa TaxID=3483 RepID=A0A7J6DUX1_CANSA|nr:hypothetical protein F8388_005126 [Cannabis sativa]
MFNCITIPAKEHSLRWPKAPPYGAAILSCLINRVAIGPDMGRRGLLTGAAIPQDHSYKLIFTDSGPSGFSAHSTAAEVTRGIDGTGLTAIVTDWCLNGNYWSSICCNL